MVTEMLDGVLVPLQGKPALGLQVMEAVAMATEWGKLATSLMLLVMGLEVVAMRLAQQVEVLAMENLMVPLVIRKMVGDQDRILTALQQLALGQVQPVDMEMEVFLQVKAMVELDDKRSLDLMLASGLTHLLLSGLPENFRRLVPCDSELCAGNCQDKGSP